MKNIFVLTTFLLMNPFSAQAQASEYCAKNEKPSCIQLTQENPFTSQSEGEFDLQILEPNEIFDLEVILWMDMGGGHGHGTGPVEIQNLGSNRFHIRNAWFVMKGQWFIKLRFTSADRLQEISIPVAITQ